MDVQLFVGQVYVCFFTSRRPLSGPLYTVTIVNLIMGRTSLMFVMNVLSCSSVPVHIRNMASMYLFHSSMYGCLSRARIGSNDPMNKLAYAGAILVPMAVPCSWRKKSPLNSNVLFEDNI